jgi:hypothetical protein
MVDDEGLKYDVMVERALRGVLRDALGLVAEQGLPGEHHFYITFRSDHPGVEIPESLRERYPSEMTIVLQNQYWGLEVGQEAFSVTLSFADLPERLTVPFESVIAFADPSVRFGLQFDSGAEEDEDGDKPSAEVTALPVERSEVRQKIAKIESKAPGKIGKAARPAGKGKAAKPGAAKKAPAEAEAADEAEIVPLDTFRKK